MAASEAGALSGKVALVTGGGGGIGSAISRRLAGAGARVVITWNSDESKAKAVAAGLHGAGHLVMHAPVDETESLSRLADKMTTDHGKLDILVNNAGITKPVAHDDLDGLDDGLIDRIFRVNFRGAFATIRAMQPLLMAADDGAAVINISSIAGPHGDGQQCSLLRQQGGDGQHDAVAGAGIGAADSGAVGVAGFRRWRICPAHASRIAFGASVENASGPDRQRR